MVISRRIPFSEPFFIPFSVSLLDYTFLGRYVEAMTALRDKGGIAGVNIVNNLTEVIIDFEKSFIMFNIYNVIKDN